MLKNRKFLCLIIVLSFFVFKNAQAEEIATNGCPAEELYFHKQKAIQINSDCKLSSSLNFKVPTNTINQIIEKIPLNNQYKTRLNIPKAKID